MPEEMILIVEETKTRHGEFDGWIEGYGKVVSSARSPFLTAARVLLKLGVDPATILTMRHKKTGTDSLRGPIGKAAKLRVDASHEGRPIFRRVQEHGNVPEDEPKATPEGGTSP